MELQLFRKQRLLLNYCLSQPATTVDVGEALKEGSRLCSRLGQSGEHAFVINKQLCLVFILSFSNFSPLPITPIATIPLPLTLLSLATVWHCILFLFLFLFTLFVCPMNRAIAFEFNNHLCNLLFDSTVQIVCPVIVVTIVVVVVAKVQAQPKLQLLLLVLPLLQQAETKAQKRNSKRNRN